MPILLNVKELEPGMTLARNAMSQFSVLVKRGRALSESDINSLVRRYPDMMVQVADPLLDQAVEFDDDSKAQEVSQTVRRNVATASSKVSKTIRSGVTLNAENIKGVQEVIDSMIGYLYENPVAAAIIDQSSNWDDYLQEHSANVFYLSLVMGNTIRNYIKEERERLSAAKSLSNAMNLTPLATAALFHDIGMTPIEHVYSKSEALTEEEIAQIKAHPTVGAQMLPDNIDPMVKLVVRFHHENQDGSGYPEGLTGDKVNIFSRIVRVADAYSAGVSQKVYQRAKNPVMVLYEMLYGDYRQYYDPVVLKVFTSIMQPMPIGAKLKLDTGHSAVVVRHNRENPFRPEIMIAYDEFGDPLPPEQLKKPFVLGQRKDVKVVSFGKEDISFLNDLSEQKPPEEQADVELDEQVFDLMYP